MLAALNSSSFQNTDKSQTLKVDKCGFKVSL